VMIFQSNEDCQREIINTQVVISQRAAGLLVSVSSLTANYDHFQFLVDRGIPLVFFDRVCEGFNASKVIVDDFDGAFQAVCHLLERGYRRIGHLAGPQNLSIGKKRMEGYQAALEKYGIPFDEKLVVIGGLNEEDGISSFKKLFMQTPQKPDAIFAVTDPVALGAFMEIKQKCLKIPNDIALVGFSDSPISSLIDPPLTTVRQPAYEIGESATKLLLQQIQHKQVKYEPKEVVLKTELIIRKST
jgi:DNA-binding LacI/PurR family transcriptional regulator